MNDKEKLIAGLTQAWRDENASARNYRALAKQELNTERKAILLRLAEAEDRHAATWVARLKELGADLVFGANDAKLLQSVVAALSPRKVDLVVDNVGGRLFQQVVAMLDYGGRISVVGRSGGPVPEFNTASLLFRRNRIGGVAVSDYTPDAAQAIWREMVSRLDAMGKRPVVDGVFGFEDAVAAFGRLAEGPMGKVLVRVS